MSITGEPGRPPVRMGLPIGDLGGGLFASQAICAALYRRERTGAGQHIDLSLLDIQASLLTYVAQYHLADGVVPEPIGSGHQTAVPYQAFATSDGHLVVAVFTDQFWQPLCDVLDNADLASTYPTNLERLTARETVVAVISARFATASTQVWVDALWKAGVPAGPVNDLEAVLADPQLRHRGMVVPLDRDHPIAGPLEVLGNPVKVGQPDRYEPAPLLGEHNDEYLADDHLESSG